MNRSDNPTRRAVVAAVIAHCPTNAAGNTWAFMNWALGLRSLGWDVWLVENIGTDELSYPNPDETADPGQSANALHWETTVRAFGFEGRATLFFDGQSPDRERFRAFAEGSELFVNLSGQFKLHDLVAPIPRRAYVDLDPAFSQIWAVAFGCDMNWASHTHFYSVGTTLATAHIPNTGIDWRPVVPPVSLDHWPALAPAEPTAPWTTVTYWYGFSELEWDGVRMGIKRDSFLALVDLPGRSGGRFRVATDLEEAWGDYGEFRVAGWEFCRPEVAGASVATYRSFIAASRGEIGVAKHGYVAARSGWLSDRTVCYLASGRPAVLQDTGWTRWLPGRPGLRAFATLDEAAEAIREIEADYPTHASEARRVAEEIFAADRVLPEFLRPMGIG
jgi:hypothetical protein